MLFSSDFLLIKIDSQVGLTLFNFHWSIPHHQSVFWLWVRRVWILIFPVDCGTSYLPLSQELASSCTLLLLHNLKTKEPCRWHRWLLLAFLVQVHWRRLWSIKLVGVFPPGVLHASATSSDWLPTSTYYHSGSMVVYVGLCLRVCVVFDTPALELHWLSIFPYFVEDLLKFYGSCQGDFLCLDWIPNDLSKVCCLVFWSNLALGWWCFLSEYQYRR